MKKKIYIGLSLVIVLSILVFASYMFLIFKKEKFSDANSLDGKYRMIVTNIKGDIVEEDYGNAIVTLDKGLLKLVSINDHEELTVFKFNSDTREGISENWDGELISEIKFEEDGHFTYTITNKTKKTIYWVFEGTKVKN